jgi:hypothetical protein
MEWLNDRFDALVDNLLWLGLGAALLLVGGSLAAFGTQRTHLPVWALVLFGAALIGCVAANCVLFRRLRTLERRDESTPASNVKPFPHPHAPLLLRIEALQGSVSQRNHDDAIEWPIAAQFNGILRDARTAARDPLLDEIEEFQRYVEDGRPSTYAYSGSYGTVLTLLAQIRAIIV